MLPSDSPPARLIADTFSGAGPLGGLHDGLLADRHDLDACTACDYPFLSPALLRLLLDHAAGRDAVVPIAGATPHVTQGVYARKILPAVESRLRGHSYRLRDLLGDLDVCWIDETELRAVDPDLRSLLNVNTPHDWERALAIFGQPAE
jgi:molybdopterin-guanine dinucleotide biosynthesis protein A